MDGLAAGDIVTAGPLESHLLLLSDLPGVQVSSALVPGATFGTSDLLLDILPGQRVTASVDADNAGNRYTGAVRVGATVNFNEPTGQGDVASLRLLTSGEGLNYFRASYQMQIGKARIGAAYSSLEYALGKEFENLLANGTAQITNFYGHYPLLRSRNENHYAGLSYETKRFQDRLDSVLSVTDKTAHVWTASLNGDRHDDFGGGGSNTYALALTSGAISILTPAARAFDATTAHSNGHFGKVGFSASRLQNLTNSVSLFARIDGQIASKNLDISEKMELGGMYAVRAYPEGEAYGDEGVVASVEARLQLPKWSASAMGDTQVFGFVDAGRIKLDSKPWAAGVNRRTLSGAGLGLSWSVPGDFLMRLIYAHRLGSELATSAPDSANRFWLQFVKYF
jgi:hemolysin activation/secretion protein